MKKVILVFPKIMPDYPGSQQWTLLPLSLLAIASPLEKAGYEVKIIDQRVDSQWEETLKKALAEKPLCVGVSVMTGFPIKGALKCSRLVKEISPDVPIIWGGIHPSLLPEQTLESKWVDGVVQGEGEQVFPHLVQALERGEDFTKIPGVYYRKNGEITGSPFAFLVDLDSLRPAYHLVDINKYLNAPFLTTKRPLAIYTSRGCPWRCRYCYNLAFNKRHWRGQSAQKVINEISFLMSTYNLDSFFLLDDNFFVNRKRVLEICNWLKRSKLNITFYNANCRIDTIDKYDMATLNLLREVGFEKLFIGVESGSDRVLEGIQKDIKMDQVRTANHKLKAVGIVPVYSFMVGLPMEEKEDIQATLSLMSELLEEYPQALIEPLNIYSPFPGTPLYYQCLESGMPEPQSLEEWADFDYIKINYTNFFQKELDFIEKARLLSNYIDPKLSPSPTSIKILLRKVYSFVLRTRLKRRFYYFMPEIKWFQRKAQNYEDLRLSP